MTAQYVIIGIILATCIAFAIQYFVREWRENIRYKNYGCAGCPFYEKCNRNKKIKQK